MLTSYALALVICTHISNLDHPAYRTRERAYGVLWVMHPVALPYLEGGQGSQRVEVAARCRELVAKIRYGEQAAWLTRARPKNYPVLPWLDMLPDDYPGRWEILQGYLNEARLAVVQDGPPHWQDYREATRLYLLHLQRQGFKAYQAVELLEQMVVHERAWIQKHRLHYTPNLEEPK